MMVGVSANENGEPLENQRLVAGATVSERFVLVRPLGRGAMGSVWLARHLALEMDVALKFIDSSLATHPNYVERFRREARAAAQISNPHVVSVLDYGTDEHGFPFMAMEYLSGVTLGVYLAENIRPPIDVVTRIVTHVSRGLTKAHELGIIHRDIKPDNVFLCGGETRETLLVKILDFGVAKGNFTASGHGTLAGQLVGSPAHMSPEQARGYKSIDHRSDLFSLGVLAYQCLTGWHPFAGAGLGEVLLSVCTLDPEPPSALVPGLPFAVDEWFEKALAKKRADRFASAREMCLAFYDALGPFAHPSSHPDSPYPQGGSPNFLGAISSSGVSTLAAPDDKLSGVVPVVPRKNIERGPGASRPGENRASTVQPSNIIEALIPLAHISGVRSVTLQGPTGECLLLEGPEPNATLDSLIASHARTVAATVESIEGARDAAHLCVRFGALTVYVRWMNSLMLVVRGESTMRALLLTIGSNQLASKLHAMVSYARSTESVVLSLGGSTQAGPGTRASGTRDPALASAPTVKLTAARPAARATRGTFDGERRTLRPGESRDPSLDESPAEAVYEFTQEEVPTRRERPMVYRGKVMGRHWDGEKEKAEAPLAPHPVAPGAHEDLRAAHQDPPKRGRLVVYRGQVLSGKARPEEEPKERLRNYRRGASMQKDELDALVTSVRGLRSAAWCDRSGVVSDESSGFDADVPCAVATISSGQLEELGQAIGAGPLLEWSMSTVATNLYVLHRNSATLVALGEPDEKAPAIAEKIAGAIASAAHGPG